IIVKNCGSPSKHQFPRQHPCRLPEQIVTAAKVEVDHVAATFNTPTGVAEIATAAQQHLPACQPVVSGLLNEASIVEQMIRHLADKTVPSKNFTDAGKWTTWTE